MCAFKHDINNQYDEYFYCLQLNGVSVTLKDYCGTSEYDSPADQRLKCYKGEIIKQLGVVPYDQSYCEYENKIKNGTLNNLFNCYQFKANLTMSKPLCDRLHPYPSNESDLKSLPNQTIVANRFKCYAKYLNITFDRQYCQLTTSSEKSFYTCLDKYQIPRKADFCNFKFKKSLHMFGNVDGFHECLKNESIPYDSSICNYKLKMA